MPAHLHSFMKFSDVTNDTATAHEKFVYSLTF